MQTDDEIARLIRDAAHGFRLSCGNERFSPFEESVYIGELTHLLKESLDKTWEYFRGPPLSSYHGIVMTPPIPSWWREENASDWLVDVKSTARVRLFPTAERKFIRLTSDYFHNMAMLGVIVKGEGLTGLRICLNHRLLNPVTVWGMQHFPSLGFSFIPFLPFLWVTQRGMLSIDAEFNSSGLYDIRPVAAHFISDYALRTQTNAVDFTD